MSATPSSSPMHAGSRPPAPSVAADLMAGQREDRRLQPEVWHPVIVTDHDPAPLTVSPSPPVRRVQEMRPVDVRRIDAGPPGRRPRPEHQRVGAAPDLGPADTELTLVHGEALDAERRRHAGSSRRCDRRRRSAGRPIDRGVGRSRGRRLRTAAHDPRLPVRAGGGRPHELTPDDVDRRRRAHRPPSHGVVPVQRRALQPLPRAWPTGASETTPATSPPTVRTASGRGGRATGRCSSRPRPSSTTWPGFSIEWLRDLAAEQRPDGRVRNYAPDPRRPRAVAPGDHARLPRLGRLGRCDRHGPVGDVPALRRRRTCSPSCGRRWCDGWSTPPRRLVPKRHVARAEASTGSAPHEAYLWDSGFHWGEWLEPGGGEWGSADQGHVATAYLHHRALLAARIGRMLGHDDDADALRRAGRGRARRLALGVRRRRRLPAPGHAGQPRARPRLRTGSRRRSRQRTAARLVELIRPGRDPSRDRLPRDAVPAARARRHRTPRRGLRAAPPGHSAVVVDDGGPRRHHGVGGLGRHRRGRRAQDVAEPLQQGRGHLVPAPVRRRGPTGRRPCGVPAIPDRAAAGRRDLRGPRRTHDSPYGRIESSWRIDADAFRLTVVVPPGTTAEVLLPDGTRREPRAAARSRCRVT